MIERPTRSQIFHNTMSRLSAALPASAVASDLDLVHGVLPDYLPDEAILAWALEPAHGYSRIPLRATNRPGVSGVAELDLMGRRVTSRRPLVAEDVLASSTGLSELIQRLGHRPFYFLQVGDPVSQIVTVSDLNRLPVRIYLFGLLNHLEGLLVDLINDQYPNDKWLGSLTAEGREEVENRFVLKRERDLDTARIDCTLLSQKLTIIAKSPDLRQRFDMAKRKEFDAYARPVNDLRNRIAHGMDPVETAEAEGRARADGLDRARDQVVHGGRVSSSRTPQWLAGVEATMRAMIEVVAGDRRL